MILINLDKGGVMMDRLNKNLKDVKQNSSFNSTQSNDFPNLQEEQLQEMTLLLMEDALEERHQPSRRVEYDFQHVPVSGDRRKLKRRKSDRQNNQPKRND